MVCAALLLAPPLAAADPEPSKRPISKKDSPWGKIRQPAEGPARAIGGYGAGCVQGAEELPVSGPGFHVVRPRRHRHFGHPVLIAYLRDLASRVRAAGGRDLLLGDLGQPRGGPAPSGHSSHQTGLDVDVWYRDPGHDEQRPLRRRERRALRDRSVVVDGALSAEMAPRVMRVLSLAADDERVARIFVNPVIKRDLCAQAGEERDWLRKLRPWWGHDAHFHVRLECPDDSPECKAQAALPAGDGCDEVSWWLDEERQAERKEERGRYRKNVRGLPELPAACAPLLD